MYMKNTGKRNSILWKQLTRFLVPLLALLTLFAAISCAGPVPGELASGEKLWQEQGLKNYDFTVERQCFCPEEWRGPVNIQVRDGAAVSVTYVSDGTSVTGGKFDNADTIDKLFTILKNAYAGTGDFSQKAEIIDVTYDAQMGYPENFWIDISQMMADEEQGYVVTSLIPR